MVTLSGEGAAASSGREGHRDGASSTVLTPDPLDAKIRHFAEEARRFSREFSLASGSVFIRDPVRSAPRNVLLAKSLFAKWSIEILFALYALRELGFQELRDTMGSITPRVLSQRLRALEDRGLVLRRVLASRPTRVLYSLTDDGLLLARLGEPVFLFLKHRHDRQTKPAGRAPRARRGRTGATASPGRTPKRRAPEVGS